MSTTAHTLLITALFQFLRTHATLGGLLMGGAERPRGLWLDLASSETLPWSSATFQGERHKLEFTLRTSTAQMGLSASVSDAACALVDALEITRLQPSALLLPGHALIDVTFEGIETLTRQTADMMRPCGCIVRFSILTLIDPPQLLLRKSPEKLSDVNTSVTPVMVL
jgi:hypothetical protein